MNWSKRIFELITTPLQVVEFKDKDLEEFLNITYGRFVSIICDDEDKKYIKNQTQETKGYEIIFKDISDENIKEEFIKFRNESDYKKVIISFVDSEECMEYVDIVYKITDDKIINLKHRYAPSRKVLERK